MRGWRLGKTARGADEIVLTMFMVCTVIPAYAAVLPAVCMFARIALDKGLRRRILAVPMIGALGGFCAAAIAATLRVGGVSVLYCLGVVAAMTAMAYFRAAYVPGMHRQLTRIVLWGCALNAVVAVVQSLRYDTAGGFRAPAQFHNPNYYAMMSGFMLIVELFALVRGIAPRTLCLVAIGCCALGLALSASRTGLVSALLGAVGLMVLMDVRRAGRYALIAALSLLAVAILAPNLARVDALVESFSTRTGLWRIALSGIAKRPLLGQGAWAFARVAANAAPLGEVHAHNLLLELLLTAGVVGTALLAVYIGSNVRGLLAARRAGREDGVGSLALAALGMTLFHGLTDLTIFGPQNAILLLLLLSVAGVGGGAAKTTPARDGMK